MEKTVTLRSIAHPDDERVRRAAGRMALPAMLALALGVRLVIPAAVHALVPPPTTIPAATIHAAGQEAPIAENAADDGKESDAATAGDRDTAQAVLRPAASVVTPKSRPDEPCC